jgi:glycosyltransferase involved in cell wall biosynthesis
MNASMDTDVVILSTADWDNPFWTNKQHVAVELARRGFRVFYVDSLGLRRPSASKQDLKRIIGRLFKAARPPREVLPHLWVWSPVVIPFQGNAVARRINRAWLSAGLSFWMRMLRLDRGILWTYNPMTCNLFPLDDFGRLVYHCVDEVKAQPGMPVREIERAETELIKRADICYVTSDDLLMSRRQLNPNTYFFPNVADFSHFSTALDPATQLPSDLDSIPRPIIGFIGAISAYKIDFALLKYIAEQHPDWSVVLIGKAGEGEPGTDIKSLLAIKNLHFIGPRKYADLPRYLKAFSVAILPSVLNEYTRGMFPMKFFEYLGAGIPVVATDLHALQAYAEYVYLAKDAASFVAGVDAALRGQCASLQSRLEIAREQTYERRTGKMLEILSTEFINRERNSPAIVV